MATMVAVDLGAQSGRVAIGRYDGSRLSVSEAHRFANVAVRTQGRLQWDVLRLYQDVLDGLRAAAQEGGRVDSVGVDSWGVDFGLLDRKGRLIQNPVHYRDARRASAVERVLAQVPARELYERTGIQLMPINTIFELAAMADEGDPALSVAETMLMIPDLLHYWLSGSRTSEFTNATTTQCFDPREGAWAVDLLDRLEIPPRLPAEPVPPGTALGPLSADVAEETGLDAATVVAPATHDTASAVAAVPFRRRGSAYISAGTWSLVGLEVDRPVIDDGTFGANLTNEGGAAGTFRLLRNVNGLWLLHECRRAWAARAREHSFDELVRLAHEAPPLRSLIEPNDPTFAAPGDMPRRIREFCARTGQDEPAEPSAVVRCILESLAFKHWQTLELLREATGAAPSEVHVVGGGARNELLCRWTAEAAGVPVLAGPAEATEIGNLVLQAIALGELASLDEGRELVRASFEPTLYEPEGSPTWLEARARFLEIAARAQPREEIGA
ncbi:MAG: rhamnulokinase [Actinomycetota bacterium]|nr:rhamnulokinase [Actinomycetota bacterium]